MSRLLLSALSAVAVLALAACASVPEVAERDAAAQALAEGAGLLPFTLSPGGTLPLRGFARLQEEQGAIAVYIEGDGRAWIDRYTPSPDPTPVNPVALRLAVIDGGGNVVYLARPGQYVHAGVDRRYWLGARFAPEVIDAYVGAVRQLAASVDASAVDLVGYSGGGAVAALVAARLRQHVPSLPVTLRTVAGNLDTRAWASVKRITPLAESLNPADEAATLRDVPQRHFVGTRDSQVPASVYESYAGKLGSSRCLQETRVDASHAGPWEEAWRSAVREVPACRP